VRLKVSPGAKMLILGPGRSLIAGSPCDSEAAQTIVSGAGCYISRRFGSLFEVFMSRSGLTLASKVGLAFLFFGAAWAGDTNKSGDVWPQWRGPHRDGASEEKGLLQEWTGNGPPLAWKASGLGEGYATVAIADGKIYTMGKRKNAVYLLALDGADGHELWATQVGGQMGDHPSSTPTVEADRVYAVGPHGDLICVQAASGKKIWQKNFVKDFGGSIPNWKFCESPLIDGDRLICTPGGPKATMVSLDKKTGKPGWRCAVPGGAGSGSGYSSIVISEGAGVKQYVQLMGQGTGCIGVEAKTGKFLWKYPRVANGTAAIPTPIVSGDFVFCTSGYGDGGSALLVLSRLRSGVTADEVYYLPQNVFQNHHGGLVMVGDYIYGGHGHNNGFPACLEWRTGKIVWGGRMRGPGTESAAVVYADGQMYFRYQNGVMALIAASPEGYKLNGQFSIPQVSTPSWAHPVVAGGQLFLREQDNLFVYNVQRN
jgi:outer membrane protein assembly factor BamB